MQTSTLLNNKLSFWVAVVCLGVCGCDRQKEAKIGMLNICIDEVSEFQSGGKSYWVENGKALSSVKMDSLIRCGRDCVKFSAKIVGIFAAKPNSGHLDAYQYVAFPDSINSYP